MCALLTIDELIKFYIKRQYIYNRFIYIERSKCYLICLFILVLCIFLYNPLSVLITICIALAIWIYDLFLNVSDQGAGAVSSGFLVQVQWYNAWPHLSV